MVKELPILKKPRKTCLICKVERTTDIYGRCRSCHDVMVAASRGQHYGQIDIDTDNWQPFEAAKKPRPERLHTCRQCGKDFWTSVKNLRYCSPECQYAAQLQRIENNIRKNRERKKGAKEPVPRNCIVCGKEFTSPFNNVKCCSPECSAIRHRQTTNASHLKQKNAVPDVRDQDTAVSLTGL